MDAVLTARKNEAHERQKRGMGNLPVEVLPMDLGFTSRLGHGVQMTAVAATRLAAGGCYLTRGAIFFSSGQLFVDDMAFRWPVVHLAFQLGTWQNDAGRCVR